MCNKNSNSKIEIFNNQFDDLIKKDRFIVISNYKLIFMCIAICIFCIGINFKSTSDDLYDKISNVKAVCEYASNNVKTSELGTVTFGQYQNENIEWLVVEKRNGTALLLSKYILDYGRYAIKKNSESKFIDWNDSLIRNWLNKDFYNSAFSDFEKKKIVKTNMNDTGVKDNVFILSLTEVNNYFGTYDEEGYNLKLATKPTKYAKNKKNKNDMPTFNDNGLFWLRDVNITNAGMVLDTGLALFNDYDLPKFLKKSRYVASGYDVNLQEGIRPAIWVIYDEKIYKSIEESSKNIDVSVLKKDIREQIKKATKIKKYKNDLNASINSFSPYISFGRYEQDNKIYNGPEKIEWIVLDNYDGKTILMSKYVLDINEYIKPPYYGVPYDFDTSEIKRYLNEDFLLKAFNVRERELISEIRLIKQGECKEYFGNSFNNPNTNSYENKRLATTATKYALNKYFKGTKLFQYNDKKYWYKDNVYYWIIPDDVKNSSCVLPSGDVNNYLLGFQYIGVRPIIALNFSIDFDNDEVLDFTNIELEKEYSKQFVNDSTLIKSFDTAKIVREYDIDTYVYQMDSVLFGKYEQDNDLTNGKETIEWLVLDRNDEEIVLLSKYVLDLKRMDDYYKPAMSYMDTEMYKFLDEEFYNTAFSDDEKAKIKRNHLYNSIHIGSPKVGLLTKDLVKKYVGLIKENKKLATTATKYVQNYEMYRFRIDDTGQWSRGNISFWLSFEKPAQESSIIRPSGGLYLDGYKEIRAPLYMEYGVRPIIIVKKR